MNWQPDLLTVCATGFGASALGLASLVSGASSRSRTRGLLSVVLAAVGWLGSLGLGLAGAEQVVWLPVLALSAVWLLLLGLRQAAVKHTTRALLSFVHDRRVHAVLLLAAGPGLIGWQIHYLDQQMDCREEQDFATLSDRVQPGDLLPLSSRWAVTDAGHVVCLYTLNCSGTEAKISAQEEKFLRQQQQTEYLIRTGEATSTSNCHGWVFTGGQHWIRGEEVDTILKENGYRKVIYPQPGDVAIFRDDKGLVVHSGLVRGNNEDGLVLIESKWGRLGRFIHTANQHCYTDSTCQYYHTRRGGHLLRGLPGGEHDGQETLLAAPRSSGHTS